MKIQFSTGVQGNSLDFQNGEYRRRFEHAEQPFDVTAEEWTILRRTKFFTPFEEAEPQQEAPQEQTEQSEQQGQQGEGSQPKRAKRRAQDNNQSKEVRTEN